MPCRKSRILIFSSSYLPVLGGVQTAAHNLAKELCARGNEVRVVTNRYPVDLTPREQVEGVLVDRVLLLKPSPDQLRRRRPDLFLASLYYGPKSYWRLTNLFNEFRPHIVNLHFPDHQIDPVMKLRNRFEFRLVVSLHGHDVERFVNGHGAKNGTGNAARKLREVLRAADAVTAVSPELLKKASLVEPTILRKGAVVANGIDMERFRDPQRYNHARPYLLGLGRLTHNKGFDLLVEAYAQYQSRTKPDLIIAGDGEERANLEKQIELAGLTNNVHLIGRASPVEVAKLLNGCLFVVAPSRTESFGIAAVEAMAAGKPVVATDVDGLRASLAGAEGFLVEAIEPTALMQGIESTLETIGAKPNFGMRNRQLAEEFSVARMTDGYCRSYGI